MQFRFLDLDHERRIVEEYLPKETVEDLKKFSEAAKPREDRDSNEPPKKKQKLKGRNKHVGGVRRPNATESRLRHRHWRAGRPPLLG